MGPNWSIYADDQYLNATNQDKNIKFFKPKATINKIKISNDLTVISNVYNNTVILPFTIENAEIPLLS